jgi:hypothetical protein
MHTSLLSSGVEREFVSKLSVLQCKTPGDISLVNNERDKKSMAHYPSVRQ